MDDFVKQQRRENVSFVWGGRRGRGRRLPGQPRQNRKRPFCDVPLWGCDCCVTLGSPRTRKPWTRRLARARLKEQLRRELRQVGRVV